MSALCLHRYVAVRKALVKWSLVEYHKSSLSNLSANLTLLEIPREGLKMCIWTLCGPGRIYQWNDSLGAKTSEPVYPILAIELQMASHLRLDCSVLTLLQILKQ